ncbi:MAG: KH domain-containing protein [Candidatus Saccharimonadales bacterium]
MADTIDQQFIEYIAKTLVENEDAVRVERTIDERGVLLQLHVAPEDLGRVIGRAGSTAKSMRTLLRALSVKNDARYNLKIVDSGDPVASVSDDAVSHDDVDATPPAEPVATDEPMDIPDHSEESDAESDSLSRSRREIADLTDDLDI